MSKMIFDVKQISMLRVTNRFFENYYLKQKSVQVLRGFAI